MRSAIYKWISGLAIASLAMPCVALGAPDSDVQRALKASKIGDYGFDQLMFNCQVMSDVMYMSNVDSYPKQGKAYMFVHSDEADAFYAAQARYINSKTTAAVEKIGEGLLSKNIGEYFIDLYNNQTAYIFQQKINPPCKANAQALLTNSSSRPQRPTSSNAIPKTSSKEDHHAQCLEARDYEGCMRVKSSGGTSEPAGDQCNSRGTCLVKTRGNDLFGLPKPMGWIYNVSDASDRISYYNGPYRVPHKGQPTRYVGIKRINRYYKSPKAGTSGTVIGGGSAYTNCTGYGSSVNCTTTGGGSRYIPGESATPGGIQNIRFDAVYDCKDNTHANYEGSRMMYGGWEKNSTSNMAQLLKDVCSTGTDEIMKLDTMKVQM